ncbi:uncharacterized protein LOC134089122 [Sardina pilchardus]|uniref:uncharacterized protein LOC134089122 n=1 Tax=Sardina pilchardus TaxID=27697 RepID=UPI002E123D85
MGLWPSTQIPVEGEGSTEEWINNMLPGIGIGKQKLNKAREGESEERDKGTTGDTESADKEMNNMLPGSIKGKGEANKAQKEGEERDKKTNGDTWEGLAQVILKVSVEGIPQQPSDGVKMKDSGSTAGSKRINKAVGKTGHKSSPGDTQKGIKDRSLDKKGINKAREGESKERDKGTTGDTESADKEMNNMLPGSIKRTGEANKAQKEGVERDKKTNGYTWEGLAQVILKVSVEGIPQQPSDGVKMKDSGGTAGSKRINKAVGKTGHKSSPGDTQKGIKDRSLDKKGRDTKEEETEIDTQGGNTEPGHPITTVKGKSRHEALVADSHSAAAVDRTDELNPKDFLYLLKLLDITLPGGVLNPEVIKESQKNTSIKHAGSIITALEHFEIQFCNIPRLGSREVQRALNLKSGNDVRELTNIIFFKVIKEQKKREELEEIWKMNSTCTGKGFRMRDKYTRDKISTPKFHTKYITRAFDNLEIGNDLPTVTRGTRVQTQTLEKMTFLKESFDQRFGGHGKNTDEMECLKFFHELGMISPGEEEVKYTRGNQVNYGFLKGILDFLVEICSKGQGKANKAQKEEHEERNKRFVIECKSTSGDMVGRFFNRPQNDECLAQLIENHEYCLQTQTYMYILNKADALQGKSLSQKAVMVIREYHGRREEPIFYWNYLQLDNSIHSDIDELRAYCQRDVLACFLAVLNLIFQKEKKVVNT